jgi:hypothetical protein
MFVELNLVVRIIISYPHTYRIYYAEVLGLKFCDLEILEMLGTNVMDVMKKEHTTPFHKCLPICDPTLRAKFFWQIQLHYDLVPEPKMFTKKLKMIVSLNVSRE